MKKLITILATTVVIGGSITSVVPRQTKNNFVSKLNNKQAKQNNVAVSKETNADILNKLSKSNIVFNYDFWKNKKMRDYNNEVRNILVNEHILTRAEANWIEMESSQVINQGAKTYQIQFSVDYYPPEISRMINVHVVDDGLSAASIAHKLATDGEYDSGGRWVENSTYYLKPTACNQYADSNIVMQNFRNILKYDRSWQSYLNTFALQHTLLTNAPNGNNVTVTVHRDAQTASATINLVAYKAPFLNLEDQDDYDMAFDVNLTPSVIQYLADYFLANSNKTNRLGFFYQVLDDGRFNDDLYDVPYEHAEYYPWWDCLEEWMGSYGSSSDCVSQIAALQAATSGHAGEPGNLAFEEALYHQIMNSYSTTYLSVFVSWHWNKGSDYDTYTYSFW